MTSIDPNARLLEYLRRQTQDLRTRPASGGAPAAARTGSVARPMASRTQVEISAIDRTDPQAPRQAFRIFLRGVLTRELGSAVAGDPEFPALVQRVQDTMEADAELKTAIEQAGELLLKRAAAP